MPWRIVEVVAGDERPEDLTDSELVGVSVLLTQEAGVLGGLLLGPLAFLMFFISGVSGSDRNRKCPNCAEFVKAEAKICKHCKTELPPLVSMRAADGSDRPTRPPTGPIKR
jgi:hypothetical protein